MSWVKKGVDEEVEAPVETKTAVTKELPEISWEEFAKGIGIKYTGADEHQIGDYASEQASGWVKEYEEANNVKIEMDLADEIRFKIEEGIGDHWSLQNVMTKAFDLDKGVDVVNQWSKRGQQMDLGGRQLAPGQGLTGVSPGDNGIVFTIAEPFLIAYIEAAYCVLSTGDEGLTLDEMDGGDVAATMRRIAKCEGWSFDLDLDRWGDQQNRPTYQDLEKIVQAHPDQVKKMGEEGEEVEASVKVKADEFKEVPTPGKERVMSPENIRAYDDAVGHINQAAHILKQIDERDPDMHELLNISYRLMNKQQGKRKIEQSDSTLTEVTQ